MKNIFLKINFSKNKIFPVLQKICFSAVLALTAIAVSAAPGPDSAPAPRPMASALPRPSQPITSPGPVKAPPSLSRSFYVARDGYPPNGGFASGTGRIKTLKPGTFIGRKGGDGTYATNRWSPRPGSLGLEPKADRASMTYWRVKRPLNVVSGKVAPAWSAPGGGRQLVLPGRTDSLVRNGYLSRSIAPNFQMSAGGRRR